MSELIKYVEDILLNNHMKEAVQILKNMEEPILFDILQEIADGDNLDLRDKAINIAPRINLQKGITFVIPFLKDSDENIRWLVAAILGDSKDERAIEPLIDCLANDSDAGIRLLAASALGRLGNLDTISHLEAALTDKGEDYEGRLVSTAARESIQGIRLRFRT